MIQKNEMGSFNCSLINMDVREKILGQIFLVMIEFSMGMESLFLFFRYVLRGAKGGSSLEIKWCC